MASKRLQAIAGTISPPSSTQVNTNKIAPIPTEEDMATKQDSKFPFPQNEGFSNDKTATATCYCGAVQMEFPTQKPGLVDTFICNCTDCRKITASMFASNFIVTDESSRFIRGEDKITKFAQNKTIATGNTMTNYFCSVCGTLMYRVSSGFPGKKIPRIGTIDDYTLQETVFKPRIEQFGKDRVDWFKGGDGVQQEHGNYYC